MNYEAGTEERKGLTKYLNFKRPETILGVQVVRSAPPRANIYTFFPRIYLTEEEISYRLVLARPLQQQQQQQLGVIHFQETYLK